MSEVKKTEAAPEAPPLQGPLGHPEKRREFRIPANEKMVLYNFELPVIINGVRFWGQCHVTEGMRADVLRMESMQAAQEERFLRGGKTRNEFLGSFRGGRHVAD